MTVQIHKKAYTNLTHLRGKRLGDSLKKITSAQLDIFKYQLLGENEFIAKLGNEEYLLNIQNFSVDLLESQQYAFQRGDAVYELSGNWIALMSEVCIYDFRQAVPGEFLMVLVAGISVWILVPEPNGNLIVGCDPTLEEYLENTLHRQINVSPFLNNGVSA